MVCWSLLQQQKSSAFCISPRSSLVSIPYKGKSSPAGRLDANESLTHANEFPIKSTGWELKGSVTKTTDSSGAGKEGAKDS